MDNQVRIFRKNPIAWWDKNVMRFLRDKYGQDKKTFLLIRSVYLALCEIESDFNSRPVNFFTKTVGTYAGLSREAAGKYINLLIKEGLIKKTQNKNPITNSFSSGTVVEILGLENADNKANEPLSGYPSSGVLRHRDTPTTLKKLSINKKIINNVNEDLQISNKEEKRTVESLRDILSQYGLKKPDKLDQSGSVTQRDYVAQEIADKLGDSKSLGCYRKIADKIPQNVIFEILASVKDVALSGKIRQSRGALFVEIIKKYAHVRGIELGFKMKGDR
ncbi:hypothetical protein KJ742_02010 [Patescibacteria group bacterium]|nr:hypothetical protein [Patescibacteria group bacterium]MBU1682698.1 hypothetical protein [Patescibacteria group bacterium]MBU1934457.1 hypothetical protein [Patescibacteria group bacterium]